MIVFAALMIARTRAGAPLGIAARPLRRIIAFLPATVGVFETGSSGIDDHGLEWPPPELVGGVWFQIDGVSCGSPWFVSQVCCCCWGAGSVLGASQVWSWSCGSGCQSWSCH